MVLTWLKKLKDAALSSLPVIVVVFVVALTGLVKIEPEQLILFGICAFMTIIGMWLFSIGAETSMAKIGEYIGASVTKKRSLAILILIVFLVGAFITIAEPDLAVLADQVGINSILLIVIIGLGVGAFVVVAALRIIFQKNLKLWLLGFYGLLFAVACLVDASYIPLSFDAGGVTTGPITVPFILALGIGIAISRGSNKVNSDSFGFVAFASVGPVLMVMIISLFLRNQSSSYNITIFEFHGILDSLFGAALPHNFGELGAIIEVSISLAPILVFFVAYNFIVLKLPIKALGKILIGIGYTYIGLVLFMVAVEAGFMPIGQKLGMHLASDFSDKLWILVAIGGALGVSAIFAEPAVHVLTDQVESVSDGVIHRRAVLIALAIGNGIAIALAITRMMFGFSLLYVVVPGYILAFVISLIIPDIYSAIAFDAGGVASGPMNTTFILPYAIGACYVLSEANHYLDDKGNKIPLDQTIMTNAFGTIALVALMPLLTIQLLGLGVLIKTRIRYKIARSRVREENDDQIIHFEG